MLHRKSKMVSFRLSADEYRLYRDACDVHGFENISELVRKAVHQLTKSTNGNAGPTLDEQLREVRERLAHLESEVNRMVSPQSRRDTL